MAAIMIEEMADGNVRVETTGPLTAVLGLLEAARLNIRIKILRRFKEDEPGNAKAEGGEDGA